MAALFGAEAIERIKEHPFLLMAMGASFEKTMQIAQSLDLDMDNSSVIAGVAQHATVRYCSRTGSTIIDQQNLMEGCSRIMQQPAPATVGDIAADQGLLIKAGDGYQVYGTALMETAVAQFLVNTHRRQAGEGSLILGRSKSSYS